MLLPLRRKAVLANLAALFWISCCFIAWANIGIYLMAFPWIILKKYTFFLTLSFIGSVLLMKNGRIHEKYF